jgi:hypothetical protein
VNNLAMRPGKEKTMRTVKPLKEILEEKPEWQDRADRQRIPSGLWAKDHWGTFAFLEVMVRTNHGQIDWDRVMVSRRNWSTLYAAKKRPPMGAGDSADEYGIRVKVPGRPGEYDKILGVCEVDAIMDMVDAGLVAISMPPISPTGNSYLRPDGCALNEPSPRDLVTGFVEQQLMPWARFSLTDRGWQVGMELAKHKDRGGVFARFEMPEGLEEA